MRAIHQSSLATLATHLAAHLDCTQDVACRQIMQAMAETGQPVSLMHLATRLQMSQEKLAAHLGCISDTEFDKQGNIVGWGITLLPTQHQFVLSELPLFTWCAFDTVLFPPLLHVGAHVQSRCEATGQPITEKAQKAPFFPKTGMNGRSFRTGWDGALRCRRERARMA